MTEIRGPIIVPLDASPAAERALEPAAHLARRLGTTVDVVTVAPPGLDPTEDEAYLKEAANALAGQLGRIRVLHGDDVADTLLGAVAAADGSILCLSTHGRSGLGQLLLGSVSEAVVRQSTPPVLLVGPQAEAGAAAAATVVCLDGSQVSEAILPEAVRWSQALGSRLWLVQVLDDRSAVSGTDVYESTYLHRTADRLRETYGVAADWDVLHGGDAADRIVDFARRLPAGIIAMGTHGRTGARRVALGSVAMRTAHTASAPVLVLRATAETA